jgi:hypothetical protein
MSPKVRITFYTKTYGHCHNCDAMKVVMRKWIDNYDGNVELMTLSAEDNIGSLKEKYGNSLGEAPVIEITRSGKEYVVTGNNPDIMVDYLNGADSIWDSE